MIDFFVPLAVAYVAMSLVVWMGCRLRPDHGAWLTVAALASVFVIVLVVSWVVGLAFLAHEPLTARLFWWSRWPLGVDEGVPTWVGVAAVVGAIWSTARGFDVARGWYRQRGHRVGPVQVVATDRPLAYAQTGRRGGIVVSTGMLSALGVAERRALFAHEQAHVRHRHDRFLLVGGVAAGVPPLAFAVRQLRHALERWADEDAAAVVGDRLTVARAVTRAALVSQGSEPEPASISGADVPARVEALLSPLVLPEHLLRWARFGTGVVAAGFVAVLVQFHHLATALSAVCPA